MILKGKELFLIVDSLFDKICVICNTKEEAERELKMIQEDLGDNELIKGFEIRHFKEVE